MTISKQSGNPRDYLDFDSMVVLLGKGFSQKILYGLLTQPKPVDTLPFPKSFIVESGRHWTVALKPEVWFSCYETAVAKRPQQKFKTWN